MKREQVAVSFADYLKSKYRNPFRATIEHAEEAVGRHNVLLLNYDAVRKDLLLTFLRNALKIEPRDFQPPPTINRSLTAAEIEVMCAVNAQLSDRRLTVQISNALIYANPDAKTEFVITPEELEILTELHAGDLHFINNRLSEPVSLCDPSITRGERAKLTSAELNSAVRKALSLVPEAEARAETGE